MSDQPKPRKQDAASPTGEWTVDHVRSLGVGTTNGAEKIADAHNAAITAEREVVFNLDKQVQEITEALITAKKQLASEREHHRQEEIAAIELARQLAAEWEKVQVLKDALKYYHNVMPTPETIALLGGERSTEVPGEAVQSGALASVRDDPPISLT